MIRLSILIPTHNRPELFKRCIDSVLKNLPEFNIEIIVNNDTHDIEAVYNKHVHNTTYLYEEYHDISLIYQLLFDRAEGEYIFFLEDDDYILPYFFDYLDFTFDINYVNYISEPLIRELGTIKGVKANMQPRELEDVFDYMTFAQKHHSRHFQLSQLIFKKEMLKSFPTGNDIHNDIKLFESFDNHSSIKYITHPLWTQTTDGNDNISFKHLNKDTRFV